MSSVFAQEISFKRVELDSAFRSEGVNVADVNRDGKIDVVVGDLWYEAPDWKPHEIQKPGEYVAGVGYSNNFADFTYDVNGDGWDDVIYVSFPGKEFWWYENPQNKPGHWKQHLIWHSICNESPDFADITGDGKPEMIYGSQPESYLGFSPIPPKKDVDKKWDFLPIGTKGNPNENGSFRYYHGLGNGDLNQDGRTDVLIGHGWFEQPPDPAAGPWTFHPYKLTKPGAAAVEALGDIHVYDFDLDGDQDLIASSAHAYGVWWFENTKGNKDPQFKSHLIDESYSQTHAMEFVDVNGDGTKDVVTGKRFFAHNGRDPGGKDPVKMFWYEVKRQKGRPPEFVRHEIVAGRDTGVGTQFTAQDVTGDGLVDVVLSNKKGVNLLIQQR
jgi:hypothetical protein